MTDADSGTNLSIEASGYLSEEVKENSTVLLEVRIRVGGGSIPLISEEKDLCDLMENIDKKCPLQKGNMTFTRNFTLPDEIPKATYLVRADVQNKEEETITCVEATVDF